MKKIVLLFVTINFLSLLSYAQAPNWLWAKSAGGMGDDGAKSVVDIYGNTYMAGYYSSSIVFGSTTLTNAGGYDVFIAKYDAAGNVVWAKSAGGTTNDWVFSVAVDASGNVYVAGLFKSPTINFGPTMLTSSGGGDLFLAKYDTAGNVVWAKSAGGTGEDEAFSIVVDAYGNAYVAGDFSSPSLIFGSTNLTNAGYYDMFLAKYDAVGNVVWAKSAGGGTGSDAANYITVDAFGNVYVAGNYSSSTMVFGSTTLTYAGGGDLFLAKYDANGNVVWAKRAGGTNYDRVASIAVDAYGNNYITGYYLSPTINFGSTTLTNTGFEEIFLTKYDNVGNVVWAKSADGTMGDYAYSVALDASGNVYVAGNYRSSNLFFGSITLTNAGYEDVFLAKYNTAGNILWAKSIGGIGIDGASSIAVDASGNAYVTGSFLSPIIIFGSTTLTNTGSPDIFHAKLNSTLGINEIHNSDNISVYPTPATNYLMIEAAQNASIEFLNIEGKLLLQQTIKQTQTELNISDFAKGIYIVKVINEKEVTMQKLIKQ